MSRVDYLKDHQAFVFELDDVLYPEKDYWLQVYYLFAQFIEYGEQIEAAPLLRFMQESYLQEGREGLFGKTAKQFGLPEKYQVNFDLLQQNAKLPLKLLLFAESLDFLKEIQAAGKPIFLLLEGDPAAQLNKIRQMEWNGLETYLKVYFVAETNHDYAASLDRIAAENHLKTEEILVMGKSGADENLPFFNTFGFVGRDKLFVP